jgi:predicted SAM-dependent methyltransferase
MNASDGFNLHIGGVEPKAGWKILNIQPLPGVDFVGDCTDLSQFADNSADRIYASHVYEHLSYQNDLLKALGEAFRVVRPGGSFMIGVPDLEVLSRFILDRSLSVDERFHIQRMIMGGQMDAHDFHKTGFTFDILAAMLKQSGFSRIERVHRFGLFRDITELRFRNQMISLNVIARK